MVGPEVTTMSTRVFLVDDQEIVRRGISGLLESEADLDYVSHLLTRLGMQRRTQVAVLATELRRNAS